MAGDREPRARRPFWLHQAVEYLLGIALIAQGLQLPEPLMPTLAGILVLFNAAVVAGPLGAFRMVPRRIHRLLDLVVIGLILAASAQPWFSIDGSSRITMGAIAGVMAVVWWYTDFAERPERTRRRVERAGHRSENIGRGAGRAAGSLVNQWRRRSR